jgi:lysophospholipase L1-like esterase
MSRSAKGGERRGPLLVAASGATALALLLRIPSARAQADASAPSPAVVAAIGDSLTDPRARGGKYLDVLRARCPRSRFDSYGVGGQMVNQMRRRFDDDLFTPGKPAYTHVIVFGGVNDLYSDLTAGRTPALIEKDLAFMYDDAHQHGAKVVAMTVAPWGGFTRYFNAPRGRATLEVNRWILSQRASGGVDAVVDAHALLSCGDPATLCPRYTPPFHDGIHFGDEGHRVLGEALLAEAFSRCE